MNVSMRNQIDLVEVMSKSFTTGYVHIFDRKLKNEFKCRKAKKYLDFVSCGCIDAPDFVHNGATLSGDHNITKICRDIYCNRIGLE